MKFVALLKKELRESLPFIIAAAVLLFVLGYLILKLNEPRVYEERQMYDWLYPRFKPASELNTYQLRESSVLGDVAPLVWLFSIVLGLAIGIRQFWIAFYSRTWDFEICRPARRITALAAKITAAIIGFIASMGLVWLLFYWYASKSGIRVIPPAGRIFIEGWFLIALGFVVYLGIALAGLSSRRWYTTKMFSLGFVLCVFTACFNDWRLWLILIFLFIGILVLLSQITEKFLNRQF